MNNPESINFHESAETVLAFIIQSFMDSMKRHGLSTPQIHALMYIFHAGECQVSDIGAMADVSNAAASQLVERLVQQGLVDRREDSENRRNKLITLSEKGLQLIRDGVISNGYLMEIMAKLTTAQRQTVHDAFTLLAQGGGQTHSTHESGGSRKYPG